MAIFRKKTKDALVRELDLIPNREPEPAERVADFSYQSDSLAQMIVDAWTNDAFKARVLDPTKARDVLAERGVFLSKPIVLTEKDYMDGHESQDPDEVVFVLPDPARIINPPQGQNLLETAKLLMAITPNGI